METGERNTDVGAVRRNERGEAGKISMGEKRSSHKVETLEVNFVQTKFGSREEDRRRKEKTLSVRE